MAAARWSPSRLFLARHIDRIALPVAMRDAPGFSASYHRCACSTHALTNGMMVLSAVSMSSWLPNAGNSRACPTPAGIYARYGFDQSETGADRALGVVLARLRITEVGQYAVASGNTGLPMVAGLRYCLIGRDAHCRPPS
jgi:hypothetical protein